MLIFDFFILETFPCINLTAKVGGHSIFKTSFFFYCLVCVCLFFKDLFCSGRLQVNDYHPQNEAFVTIHDGAERYLSNDNTESDDILISGSAHR